MLYLKRTFSFEYDLKEAQALLVGVPFDSTQTGASVRNGPVFIREAIKSLPGYDPFTKTNPFEKTKLLDMGDIEVVPGSWELTRERIQDTVKWILGENREVFPVFLGGEHLITLGILEAFRDILKQKITVVHFDAHRDLLPEYIGLEYSHITWANRLLHTGNFKLVQLGCRSWHPEEEGVMKKYGVIEGLENLELKGKPTYITFDLDVFDPGDAPEVGTPEPLGPQTAEVFSWLEKACQGLLGMDIVECASDKVGTRAALMGAQVFKKVLAYQIKGGRWK